MIGTQTARRAPSPEGNDIALHPGECLGYQNGSLHQEQACLEQLARAVGTPVYCYSLKAIQDAFDRFHHALTPIGVDLCFAVKANGNIAVLRALAQSGAGADIVSEGELTRSLVAGMAADRIIFSGAGKTRREIDTAIRAGVGRINVESPTELEWVLQSAVEQGRRPAVSLRLNPDIDAGTHAKITTGTRENKFGMLLADVRQLFLRHSNSEAISLTGLAVHIGSQIMDLGPYRNTYAYLREQVLRLRSEGCTVDHLSLGGGVGISYDGSQEISPEAFADVIGSELGDLGCRMSVELGRAIVARAGILIAETVHIKHNPERRFVFIDGGMNDLLRPALYDARHPVVTIEQSAGQEYKPCDLVGPVCESSDVFGRDVSLPEMRQGSLIALRMAGAYGAVMASTYNGRSLVPEVLVSGDRFEVIRERQNVSRQIEWERIPQWIQNSDDTSLRGSADE